MLWRNFIVLSSESTIITTWCKKLNFDQSSPCPSIFLCVYRNIYVNDTNFNHKFTVSTSNYIYFSHFSKNKDNVIGYLGTFITTLRIICNKSIYPTSFQIRKQPCKSFNMIVWLIILPLYSILVLIHSRLQQFIRIQIVSSNYMYHYVLSISIDAIVIFTLHFLVRKLCISNERIIVLIDPNLQKQFVIFGF